MMCWKVVIVALFYFSFHACDTRSPGRAPRAKRGAISVANATFQNSVEEINLLFEIMLSGLQIDEEQPQFTVRDEELASLRLVQNLEETCRDTLPKKLTDIRRLTSDLSQGLGIMRAADFEVTVLALVYTAQRMAHTTGHQREAWAESFVGLYNAIKQDLMAQ